MLLFWCSWFKYRFIKLDYVTVGNIAFFLVVYLVVNVRPSMRVELNHGLRDAQNVCALTKLGTVLKKMHLAMILKSLTRWLAKNG